jgi:transcription antitermination factor NusG
MGFGATAREAVTVHARAGDEDWFAVRVRSNHERKVASSLEHRGIESFLPLYRKRCRWSDRMREVDYPLFTGYVFSRFAVERRLPVLQVPGVVSIVGRGREPVPVDAGEMQALRLLVASIQAAEPFPYLRIGDRVRVDRGPLKGLEGQLVASRRGSRFVVSVSLLQRAVAVEIDERWVTPMAGAAPSACGHGDAPQRPAAQAGTPAHAAIRMRRARIPARRTA